jgi:hypothetical protein
MRGTLFKLKIELLADCGFAGKKINPASDETEQKKLSENGGRYNGFFAKKTAFTLPAASAPAAQCAG